MVGCTEDSGQKVQFPPQWISRKVGLTVKLKKKKVICFDEHKDFHDYFTFCHETRLDPERSRITCLMLAASAHPLTGVPNDQS